MKQTAYIILILLLNIHFAQSQDLDAGKNGAVRIGAEKNLITLDKYPNTYLFTYKDISTNTQKVEKTFEIKTERELGSFKDALLKAFSEQLDNPSNFETELLAFRMYYNKRIIRKDYVEVIVEDKMTEETSTLPWLTETSIKKLFNKAP
jgi:hypothetical protein